MTRKQPPKPDYILKIEKIAASAKVNEYQKNDEGRPMKQKLYKSRRKLEDKVYKAGWRDRNRERIREYDRAWRKKNWKKVQVINRRKYLKKRGNK